MRVLIACGGSGGHLFPGMAVAEALLTRGHEVRLLVSEKAVDEAALRSLRLRAGWALSLQPMPAIGYNGTRSLWRFGLALARATRVAARVCEEFGPHAVLGMGGFTSAPVVLAARWKGTATFLHESNAIPGKANRWTAAFAEHIAVGLPDCARYFRRKAVSVTGTPLRSGLRRGKIPDAREQLGLQSSRLTVLVVGGSQGARAINEAVAGALPWLGQWRERVQFVHVSGAQDEARLREVYEQHGCLARVMGFCDRMELAYSAADLVISRAGAGTLTEIAAFGLPSILIPYPFAASDHQTHNARVLERAGAARLIQQAALGRDVAEKGERLAHLTMELLGDETRRRRMSEAARALAVLDAHQRIANLIEEHAHQIPTV